MKKQEVNIQALWIPNVWLKKNKSISNFIQLFHLHCSDAGKLPSDYLSKALCYWNFRSVSIVLLESKLDPLLLHHFKHLTLQGKNISELMSFSVWYRAPNVIVKKLTGQHCHCNSQHETLLILHKMINWRLEPHATFTVSPWKLATWSNSVYKDLFQDFIFTDWKAKGTILITYADLLYKTGHRTSWTNVNYGLINFILWQT